MPKARRKGSHKRPYERPRMLKVRLAAEEVLAVGCKLSSGGFSYGGTPCTSRPCSAAGS